VIGSLAEDVLVLLNLKLHPQYVPDDIARESCARVADWLQARGVTPTSGADVRRDWPAPAVPYEPDADGGVGYHDSDGDLLRIEVAGPPGSVLVLNDQHVVVPLAELRRMVAAFDGPPAEGEHEPSFHGLGDHQAEREAAYLRLERERNHLTVRIDHALELTYASDDGTEYAHNHPDGEGQPECPRCWADGIRQALGEATS
jgi:hypothetical protein